MVIYLQETEFDLSPSHNKQRTNTKQADKLVW